MHLKRNEIKEKELTIVKYTLFNKKVFNLNKLFFRTVSMLKKLVKFKYP